MNISFGAKILTKPERFYLPTDNLEDRKFIRENFEVLEKFFDIPAVKKTTENDTLTLKRSKAKKHFNYQILYKPQGKEGFKIIMNNSQVKTFCAAEIFKQVTYCLARLEGIKSERVFQPDLFRYILRKLYLKE